MAKRVEDGGSAFPHLTDGGYTSSNNPGMTLRDHFAGLAMQGLIEGYDFEVREKSANKAERTGFDDLPHKDGSSDATFASQLADEAYLIADAMLVARQKETQ